MSGNNLKSLPLFLLFRKNAFSLESKMLRKDVQLAERKHMMRIPLAAKACASTHFFTDK